MVSEPIVTKGKREAFVCGELEREGQPVVGRVRARRLDRDETPENRSWDEARRGHVLSIEPRLAIDAPRIGPGARVVVEAPDAVDSRAARP
jgi:hypothetical protein